MSQWIPSSQVEVGHQKASEVSPPEISRSGHQKDHEPPRPLGPQTAKAISGVRLGGEGVGDLSLTMGPK